MTSIAEIHTPEGDKTEHCTLHHDGCVVCSDAGIPVTVLAVDGADAVCRDYAGNEATIAIELTLPVSVGEVLLTHGGVAIGRVRS